MAQPRANHNLPYKSEGLLSTWLWKLLVIHLCPLHGDFLALEQKSHNYNNVSLVKDLKSRKVFTKTNLYYCYHREGWSLSDKRCILIIFTTMYINNLCALVQNWGHLSSVRHSQLRQGSERRKNICVVKTKQTLLCQAVWGEFASKLQ